MHAIATNRTLTTPPTAGVYKLAGLNTRPWSEALTLTTSLEEARSPASMASAAKPNGAGEVVGMDDETVEDGQDGWIRVGRRGTKTARPAEARSFGKVVDRVIRASRMPRFGVRGDTKIIVRPRGGLDLRRVSEVALAAAVKNAAGVELPAASEDLVCINGTQNVIVISCSCKERARKYVGITALKMGDTLHEARAYATVPEGCAKGVIRGIPLTHTRKQIEEALLGPRNPSLIAAERIGSSGAVIVVFEGEVVPSRVVFDSVVLRPSIPRFTGGDFPAVGRGRSSSVESRTSRSRSRSTGHQVSWAQVAAKKPSTGKGSKDNELMEKMKVMERERQELIQTNKELKAMVEALTRKVDQMEISSDASDNSPPMKRKVVGDKAIAVGIAAGKEQVQGQVDWERRFGVLEQNGRSLVVAGDFNASHETLGHGHNTRKALNLFSDAEEVGLMLVTDPGLPTRAARHFADRDTTPDLVYVNDARISWENLMEDLGSDHRVVEIEVPLREKPRQWRVKGLVNWDLFRALCPSGPIENVEARNRALRKRLAQLNGEIRKHCEALSRQQWDDVCARAEGSLHCGDTWQLLRHLLNEDSTKAAKGRKLKEVVGRSVRDLGVQKVKDWLKNKFLGKGEKTCRVRYEGPENPELDKPFEMWELRAALTKANRRSAPGLDGISNSVLSNLSDEGLEKLLDLYNKVWEEGALPEPWRVAKLVLIPKHNKPPDLEHLRPISITSCVWLIPKVPTLRVLGLVLQEKAGNSAMLDRLRAKVLAAMRLIQRVSSRRRGIREEGVLRLVQAFALSHIMYVGPYLKWWKAELNKLDAMVRKACRAGLGVLSFTHNADLDALGVHNSVTEMIEAHREAQELRLAGTAAGREILARVGVSRGNTGLAELPNETMRCVKVRPIPRHMHPTRDAGRRAARAQALERLFLKSGGAVCVDAAVRDGVGVAVVTDLATGEIKTALSVRGGDVCVTEGIAISLAVSLPGVKAVLSDSMTAVRGYARGRVPPLVAKLCKPRNEVEVVWTPAHMGGNVAPDRMARELLGRAFGGAAVFAPVGYGEVLRAKREARRVYPPPHENLSREEAVLLRQLQVKCIFTPVLGRYVAPDVYRTDACVICGEKATVMHVLWDCSPVGAPGTLPEMLDAGVKDTTLEGQRRAVQKARELRDRQVRNRAPCTLTPGGAFGLP
ncbi:hypothetical protein HPB47_006853 [Ixodes persulcatus]|uniref:Uncharacterized protein n=1 Tax=Ixodes persulcatus TaxID=34615 RepID=A0AC60P9M8_IXOPE|nr:hypothetical protein HPB47_006853 [Ixodes persulcatus]